MAATCRLLMCCTSEHLGHPRKLPARHQGQPGHDGAGTGPVPRGKPGRRDNIQLLFEITLNNLKAEGDIDEKDFLDRADILCSLGHTVLISNYQEYYKLIEYFSRYTKKRMGVIMGGNAMMDLFNERYYRDLNGGISRGIWHHVQPGPQGLCLPLARRQK